MTGKKCIKRVFSYGVRCRHCFVLGADTSMILSDLPGSPIATYVPLGHARPDLEVYLVTCSYQLNL